jgi:esterase/lipase/1-acyl-sn-glycerol-3-phosphate acyltransferase
MIDLVYSSSSFMLKVIDTILQTNIRVHGEENLDRKVPTLFVANHFTRFETLVMPYVINERSNRKVRSLADKSLFIGLLATYLKYSKALSTADTDRNAIIIGDLMSGRNNWIIYPEGFMVKNKKVTMESEFIIDVPGHHGPVFTGAALMALEAEKMKQLFRAAQKEHDVAQLSSLRAKYFFGSNEECASQSTRIVPVNITYYPLRPGHNLLMNMTDLLAGKDATKQTKEEIEIEGNLLSSAEIHIRFCEPIDISLFMLDKDLDNKEEARELRHQLTTVFMETIYQNVLVTIDHLFCIILEMYQHTSVEKAYLTQALYMLANKMYLAKIYHRHETIEKPLLHLFLDEGYAPYDELISLALQQKILTENSAQSSYTIDHKRYRDDSCIHTVRIENTLRVIYNEVAMLKELHENALEALSVDAEKLSLDIFYAIYRQDMAIYTKDYKQFYSVLHSRAKEAGEPFILFDEKLTKGIVFAHGLKSSPSEIRDLCVYLHLQGFNVYGVRLRGHGTLPEDLRDVAYTEWLESFNRGYAAMRQVCNKIYLGGFSTGGLVALLSASRKRYPVEGVICINAALALQDVRVGYAVPALNAVNDFLALFNADVEYIDLDPENPDINYSRIYVSTLAQLRKLMAETRKGLKHIHVPLLVIQGGNDPVVNPAGAKVIMESVSSKNRELYMPPRDRHVIITGEGSEEIYQKIGAFMKKRKNAPKEERS